MMAKRRRPKTEPLAVGAVYAMPLEDGRWGACRVVRGRLREEFDRWKGYSVVAATAVVADAPPALGHPDLRRIIVLNHHAHRGDPAATWLTGPPPKAFKSMGHLAPSPDEATLHCDGVSSWEYLAVQALMQWRWDHDRAAVRAQDAARDAELKARQVELAKKRKQWLDELTYAKFLERKLFPHWSSPIPQKMIAASRKLMKQTATRLKALGAKPDREAARLVLRDCILGFNKLDEENDHWIGTIEREDICEHFYELAHIAGFDNEPELADEWRDW